MIGTMLGNRYELLEKIGEGGMALVYKAKCHLLNRYVAVKILKEQYSDDKEFVEKFKREATAAASLSDNNIVNIYDVGTQGDVNYIVMEYVKGKTLKQIIREAGRVEPSKAVDFAIQIAKALECAHKNNIIHRDIKPHNILVTEEGLIKVTDFGIAKASNSVTITNSSKIMGSAHYFSPEQARGSFVDVRTDIYSLGIVIYEMATGRVPYDADSPVSVALKHIQEPVVPPKQINGNIPESLNKLILKAVEKEPIKRYQTIKDMLLDLRKIESNREFKISTNDFDDDMTRIMDPIVIDDNYSKENKNAENPKKPKRGIDSRKRRTIMGAAIAILIIVIGAVSGYFAYSKLGGSNGETVVPNIVGMKQEDAKRLVEEKKLKFVAVVKEKSDKPEGTVLRTYPEEGTKVKVNSEVRVNISGGQDTLGVPNLVGVDLETAKDIITSSGLKLGNVAYKYSDTVTINSIISQSPEPDSNANSDTKVSLVVSRGPEVKYIAVPDVSGKNIEEGASAVANAGLKVSRNPVNTTDKALDGKITSQSVGAGQQVKEGTTINLSYYKYTEPVKKPEDNTQKGDNNNQQPGDTNGKPDGGNQQGGDKGQNNGGSGTGGTNTEGQQGGESNNTTDKKQSTVKSGQ
ncbi:Stk1 family PASTA domain-containing Ser/Thr kinase [Clostridium sp. CX1]|uniref:Stk1 family PASTA domain-containing Ser/Thr kinase n=1 Tax=Clostridium sp. CX1 TaxID=2978346 RepID=UPI0021BF4A27|nr:Stk1 family PASTA domain-containing Ser/Thr kinase [Clostridium sp. CX1]MCT8976875.1 Stk1 family PASTA domain-containing Ser/Thr kinase [Clostridium sp. CX1]